MNVKKSKLICLLALLCFALSLGGCTETPIPSQTTEKTSFSEQTLAVVTQLSSPASTEAHVTEPVQTEPSPVTTDETEPVPHEFSDLVSLSFYLNDMKSADVLDIRFQYSGNDVFDAGTIARMTNACYVTYYEENGLYELRLTEYPGDRIVDAWFSGDTSLLSEDELNAMNKAAEIVALATETASDPIELELFLHDSLVGLITYSDNTREISDPLNPPRNLTAVGALLDGYANCQGYTDAFYVLASMAGFEVGRMSVYTPNDLHVVNTILLDGNWYVVDVTFDDVDSEGSNYRLFNAGVDVIHEYTWHDYNRFYPISAESDENYYYIRYDLVYSDVNALAADIASAYANGEGTVFRAMLTRGEDNDQLNTALYDELVKLDVVFNYTYWFDFTGQDTVYTVYFE